MAQKQDIRQDLLAALERVAPDHGIDIVDVEVVGSAKAPTVRVRIDHADPEHGPISLDEVGAQTAWISELVDEADPIEGSYTLEVSSPGMARPLRKEADFVRFAGERVKLTTKATEGRKRYTGVLGGMDDKGCVIITCDEGTFSIELSQIQSCKIQPNYDAL